MDRFVPSSVKAQVDAVLAEIASMEGSEFPYEHTQDALLEAKEIFEKHKALLSLLGPAIDRSTIDFTSNAAFVDVKDAIDLLGFLLRSTNIRNAFECYGPMLRLARKVLGPATKLIISSEWQFAPFTFVGYAFLEGYVMIGLPATESSNPFLLPLAGHELGHTAWVQFKLAQDMEKDVELAVIEEIKKGGKDCESFFHGLNREEAGVDLLARAMWKPAWDWALRQCEEHFCDFFGLYIFREAYLHAFAYLIAPQKRGVRSLFYPNIKTRAECLVVAAVEYGIEVPAGYADVFVNLQGPTPEHLRETVLLKLADAVRIRFLAHLRQKANEILSTADLEPPDTVSVENCRKRMQLMIPAEKSGGLVNIINAGWQGWLDETFFREPAYNEKRLENLREIVLKSIEVLEIENKLSFP